MCGKCEWCHAGQYRHCENTDWRYNPDAIRYGYTSAEKAPHLWGGFAQYVYLPWNAVVHHVPKGVSPELAGLVTPMANGVEWSLFDGGVGYNSTVLIQGPGQQGLSQTVICKQAGASLIIVTGTSKDAARLEVAKLLGADHVIDVNKEDPLARIMEITGNKGVDVVLDCTAGAGTIPILLGIEAMKRKAGMIVVQGEMAEFPNFPIGRFTVKAITAKSARGHSYKACELALAQLASKRFPLEKITTHRFGFEGRRPRDQVGRRPRRTGRDPRLPHALDVTARGHLEAVDRVKDWTRGRFRLEDGDLVMVSEVVSKLPGHPPLQTAVSFWVGEGDRHHFTVFKRVEDVLEEDIPPAFMKNALALSEGVSCSCC
jgi:threonine dehydrogenase-like Zn-dependent dehydrogenase